ncbi:MAG: porin family protein [Bdellovibrionota bacterium]
MNKLILLFVVNLAMAICLLIPRDAQAEIALGLHGGISLSDASVEPELSTDYRAGAVAGVFSELKIAGEVLYLQGEFNYVQKGAEQTVLRTESKIKLDYIEIPLLLKAKYEKMDFKPFILAGPALGFNVNASGESTIGRTQFTSDLTTVDAIDFGLLFGIGAEYHFSSQWAGLLTARYSLGLVDVVETATTWKNHGLQTLAGVMFKF